MIGISYSVAGDGHFRKSRVGGLWKRLGAYTGVSALNRSWYAKSTTGAHDLRFYARSTSGDEEFWYATRRLTGDKFERTDALRVLMALGWEHRDDSEG